MQNIEDENSRTAIEAAGGGAVIGGSDAEGDGGFNPLVKPIELTRALAPDAKTNKKEELVSEESEEQRFWDSAPVDSVGVDPAVEAHAYETVVKAADAPVAAAASAPVAAEAQVPRQITIDDFAKVELRVAQILVAERVPKADKLLRLEVDLGYEKRQILAGIAQYYEPDKLIGRKIVIVANLAPRKMRGLESNGMLLAASLPPDGAPVLAGFLEDVPLGARLK
jgi:methionyl-tRNA synthetase